MSLYRLIFNDLIKLKSDKTDSRAATITPVIDVIKMEEDKLGVSVGLLVGYNQEKIAWKGKYRYKLTEDYIISGIAEGWTEEKKTASDNQ